MRRAAEPLCDWMPNFLADVEVNVEKDAMTQRLLNPSNQTFVSADDGSS